MAAVLVQAQEQKCRVGGQVFSVAGMPLKKTTVELRPATQMNQSNFRRYSAPTDGEGKFAFENIAPGTYVLCAQRVGYLGQCYGARSSRNGATRLKLETGQEIKDLVIKLTPQGMIFGRVVDSDGDPLPGAAIEASRWSYVNGKKRLNVLQGQSAQADGTFVIGELAAGRYYISADPSNFGFADRTEQTKPQESNFKTYYPDALDADSATVVEVAAGAEVRGIEIRVRKGRGVSIRGRLESTAGAFPNYAAVVLSTKENPRMVGRADLSDRKTTTFQFRNVLPGTYVLEAQDAGVQTKDPTGEFSKWTQLAARAEITVGESDINDIVLQLHVGMEIRGTVKMDGGDLTKFLGDRDRPALLLRASDAADAPYTWNEVEKDGTLRVQSLDSAVYQVDWQRLPENMYVKSIAFDGKEISDNRLDLTSSTGGKMEIVLSANGAEVSGIVRDAEGKPVPGALVQICDANQECPKTGNTDQNAAFDFKGLAPGDYKVFAWEDRGEGIITADDFRRRFESKSTPVKLNEKSHETIDAVLITKDAMDAEAAKIQ